MNNFGVIEVASTRTTHAPGWAYVPDTTINQALTAHGGTNRKRARNQPALSLSDVSARHEAKIQKEIDLLNRDNHKDANIPIPPKTGSRAQNKHTPNVRKILASQKTFGNYLDDYEAILAHESHSAAPASAASRAAAAAAAATPQPAAGPSSKRHAAANAQAKPTPTAGTPLKTEDVEMADAPSAPPRSTILAPYASPPPAMPGDDDPLLESWVPPLPTDDELRELLAAPPLNYVQARGAWGPDERRYPPRHFCELCGYWGRVRCLKCGTRVCALECLEVHREECVTRYGL